MCCAPIVSRPCSDTFLTVHIPTFLYIFNEMFFTTCLHCFFSMIVVHNFEYTVYNNCIDHRIRQCI